MLQAERLEKIRDYIMANKYANINVLAENFRTSSSTIRRYLKKLEDENLIENVRGGAVLISDGNISERPYLVKQKQNENEKKRIASYACKYVHSNTSLYLDSSTTVLEMTQHLKTINSITICTNDVLIASKLSCASDAIVMVTGGILRQGYYTLSGYFADQALDNLQVDYAFMGVDAIGGKGGFMITNTEEVGIKQKILEIAGKTIVLCDHSKFDKGAFLNIWNLSDVDIVITGKELSDEQFERYTELGLNIVRV